jgi:phosphatidylserine/phosphatidylglycerophosphate/cardiolipin synthase-like enzyme
LIDRISRRWLFVLPAFLLGASLEYGSGSAQAPCPVGPPAEVHYSPGENLETIDVALISEAAKQIDMAAYVLTDSAVVEALRAASARREHGGESRRLRRGGALRGRVQGLELRSNAPGGELMHLKGYCVDHRLLRTGSANFSRSGETRQDNDLVALRGASVCAGFDAKFDRAWTRS